MRVAIDVRVLTHALRNSPSGGPGGGGRYALGLLPHLFDRADEVEYILVTDRGGVPQRLAALAAQTEGRVRLAALGFRRPVLWLNRGRFGSLYRRGEAPWLERELASVEADVVHFLEPSLARLESKRSLTTLHDLWPFVRARHERPRMRLRSSLIACDSESTAVDAHELLGVSRERLVVVYPGVAAETFRPDGDRVSDLPFDPRNRYFLHVGVLRERKNPEGLLRAFAQIAQVEDRLRLVCVGPYQTSPPTAAAVLRRARELGIGERVHMLGDCSDESLAKLYRSALALVFPSLYEGFGFPVLESLACGTPCVTSDVASLPEVGGDLAVYVDPADPASIAGGMRRLLDDDGLRTRVREGGPRWASRFSWARTADSIVAMYRTLAGARAADAKVR